MIDRRTFLAGGVAGLAYPEVAGAKTGIADRYRRAIVIDGNLVPPITALGPLSSEVRTAIRSSGLTAIKADLDGADTFDSVADMIRDYQAVIASNDGLLAQVREVIDIQRCKEAGKLGKSSPLRRLVSSTARWPTSSIFVHLACGSCSSAIIWRRHLARGH